MNFRRRAETAVAFAAARSFRGRNRHIAGYLEDMAMKQYLLSICYPAGATQPPPDALQKIMRDVVALQKEMQAAGVWVFSGGLAPPTSATVLRQQSGEIVTTDGPFI